MARFLSMEQSSDLYSFIRGTLSTKYGQKIDIEETEVVTGLTGSDIVEDAIKIVFIPAEANVQWVEDKIADDLHRYCYDNNIRLCKSIVIERDLWLGKIRYKLVYTNGEL